MFLTNVDIILLVIDIGLYAGAAWAHAFLFAILFIFMGANEYSGVSSAQAHAYARLRQAGAGALHFSLDEKRSKPAFAALRTGKEIRAA